MKYKYEDTFVQEIEGNEKDSAKDWLLGIVLGLCVLLLIIIIW